MKKERYYIYILRCHGDLFYVGQTNDIRRRLFEHITGQGATFTKKYFPCGLVHLEIKETREEALLRESELIKLAYKKRLKHDRLYVPPEMREIYYRVAAFASTPESKWDCIFWIDMPYVAEWDDPPEPPCV